VRRAGAPVIAVVALFVALGCAAASARRVWLAVSATAIDPDEVLALVTRNPERGVEVLRRAAAADTAAEWERDLLEALSERDAEKRAALVNEQLTELGRRMERWSAVPRVCARVSSSAAFLLAALVLRQGLSAPDALSPDVSELLVDGLIGQGLTVAALGFVGTAFCVAAHGQTKRLTRTRAEAADKMVERLESLVAARYAVTAGIYRGAPPEPG
jgi:hypothetical protein